MCDKRVPKVTYPHRAIFAPLAQLIRASGLRPECRDFEILPGRLFKKVFSLLNSRLFLCKEKKVSTRKNFRMVKFEVKHHNEKPVMLWAEVPKKAFTEEKVKPNLKKVNL